MRRFLFQLFAEKRTDRRRVKRIKTPGSGQVLKFASRHLATIALGLDVVGHRLHGYSVSGFDSDVAPPGHAAYETAAPSKTGRVE